MYEDKNNINTNDDDDAKRGEAMNYTIAEYGEL